MPFIELSKMLNLADFHAEPCGTIILNIPVILKAKVCYSILPAVKHKAGVMHRPGFFAYGTAAI